MSRPFTTLAYYEWLNPVTDEYEELEFEITIYMAPAEPDIGLPTPYIEEITTAGLTPEQEAALNEDTTAWNRIIDRAAEEYNESY